ncbi:Predicted SnoaL-like aldol condensation-catalyzing enzyme [Rhizobium sp. RU35A]|uniref:nuclear transport factor 2 family protein n=1 Tax=Rhizobium sp. RU35A TaxID=1907414 RepID=UPI0009546259|nr:nuclear transport factor 2 family protein [Rhizobium sp. RU35A]SIQ68569.1 Predicted SnoaL-like aldol condensation-catalyzing enzyme [Rhizobium sp. RU35A]
MKYIAFVAALALGTAALPHLAATQEAVVAAADKEAQFTSPDPALNANKQLIYKIYRDLLEAHHWDRAADYLSERYIQHNPNAPSGRQSVVDFFTKGLGVKPIPIEDRLKSPIVFVQAEGDLVTVATVRTEKDPKDPAKTYTTTWFDTWRIIDGKADEHWDSAVKR